MKKIIVAAVIAITAAYSNATDLAIATAVDGGSITLTDDVCKTDEPIDGVKILQIRHTTKTGKVTNGCYIATISGIHAAYENGSINEYNITDFKWTPAAIERLNKKHDKKLYI
jgi:hypothetical protein